MPEPAIQFRVYGVPKAQPRGRAYVNKATGRAGTYDPGTADYWRAAVRDEAVEAINKWWRRIQITCGVELKLMFWMPRPQHHYRTGKHAGELKPNAPTVHTKKPDLDNLAKAVMDAITDAGLWRDDSLVYQKHSMKVYGERPGVEITITELANEQENRQ